jgi:hypothetical protein
VGKSTVCLNEGLKRDMIVFDENNAVLLVTLTTKTMFALTRLKRVIIVSVKIALFLSLTINLNSG